MTPVDLITRALRTAGVYGQNETVSAPDLSDSFAVLNEMLDSWSTARLYVYQIKRDTLAATGALSYTVGAGGDFNTTRPTQVTNVIYSIGGNDYPVAQKNRKDFDSITAKNVQGYPDVYDYEPEFPLGKLYLWPAPVGGTIKIDSPQQLTQFATPTTDIALPPGYQTAIRLSLAVTLAQEFRMPVPPELMQRAGTAVRRIRRLNTSIPTLPAEPVPHRNFDIYSDT